MFSMDRIKEVQNETIRAAKQEERVMTKSYRTPKAKEGELLAKYGKADGELDLFYCWRGDSSMRRDSKLLSHAFESMRIMDDKTLRQELEARGYDITTLRFSIMKKAT